MRNLGLSLDDFKKKSDFLILTLIALISLSFALIWTYFSYLFVFAIILFSATIILFFKKPDWFLYFFAFSRISLDALKLVYFEDIKIGMHWSLSLDGIINGIFILCAIIYLFKEKEIKIWELPGIKPFFIFILICLISLFYSLDKILGLRHLIHYLTYFLIYILGAHILNTKEKNYKMIIAILLSCLIPIGLGLYQAITLKGNYETFNFMRISATAYHPNPYAFYLVTILIFIFIMYLYTNSWKKKIYLFLLTIPISISLVLTYSRIGWLAGILGWFIFFLFSKGKNRYKIFLLFFIITVIGIVYFKTRIAYRFARLLSLGLDTLGWRIMVWTINFKEFLKNPITGYGIGSAEIIAQKRLGDMVAPHNDYLRLMIELGLAGLIIFLTIIFSLIRFFLCKYKTNFKEKEKILALGMLVLILDSSVISILCNLHHYDYVYIYFWFLIVIGYNFLKEI